MPLIQIPVGIAPCQVDDFPKSVGKGESAKPLERSCKGAMYIRPASTQVMTQDELDFLQEAKQHPWGKRLLVVDVKVMPDKSDRPRCEVPQGEKVTPAATSTPPPTAPPPVTSESSESSSGDTSSSESSSSSSSKRRRGRG